MIYKALSGCCLSVALLALASPSWAQSPQNAVSPGRAGVLDRLAVCRTVTDPVTRLACYDQEFATLDSAERSGDIVVVERAEVQRARRALFGLDLPRFNVFDRGAAPEAIDRVESTIRTARRLSDGDWLFELEDDSIWRQTDGETLSRARTGMPVLVRRGAMGAYLLSVDGARSLRVRRQQ